MNERFTLRMVSIYGEEEYDDLTKGQLRSSISAFLRDEKYITFNITRKTV